MTRPKAVIVVVVVALAFAGLASWMVYDYLHKEAEKTKASQAQTIVVAAVDIPLGSKINATQVKTMGWPKESVPPGSFTDPKAIVDAGRTNLRPISAGEPVTEAKLIPKEGTAGVSIMTYLVPEGHRAVTVAVNEVAGVAGFISPHNRVDVVVTTIPTGSSETISKIVLQDVPILATGQITDQKEGKPVVVPTVTLDLTPGDSEKLVVAASKGSLQLLLRNVADKAVVDAKGATIYKVLGTVERPTVVKAAAKKPAEKKKVVAKVVKPAPVTQAPPPPAPYSVEIIKGANKTTRQFAPEQ
jgi:pilus assembly protein CpaB